MTTHKTQITMNVFYACVGLILGLLLASCIVPRQVASINQAFVSPLHALAQKPSAVATPSQKAVVVHSASAPGQEMYKNLPVGFTKEGYPYRGAPTAPITINEYSDFQCPFCGRHFTQTEATLNEKYVRSGQVRVVFHDFPLEQIHPNALAAHVAARCAGEQSATLYWQMHDQLFATQAAWSDLPDPTAYFTKLADTAGVNRTKYASCIATGHKASLVEQSIGEGDKAGFGGTPSFQFVRSATGETFPLIGAQRFERFANVIDTLVAGKTPEAEPQAAPPTPPSTLPQWATAASLALDPKHAGYDMAGDEIRGSADAKVTVIEISDFQCPFCRHHVEQTQPVLDRQFVDTGKVRWVFKHFPLDMHPQAVSAAVAAECAAEQGKFWPMHDLIFKQVETWSVNDPTAAFAAFAQQLQLDLSEFRTCLQSERIQQQVQSDRLEAAPFVQGTPTFIILANGKQQILPGALPAARFSQMLQQALDTSGQ